MLLGFASMFCWLCVTVASAQRLEFSLPNHLGQTVLVGGEANTTNAGATRLTAVCFLGTECPMARAYARQLTEMQSELGGRGVRIVGVMSNSQDTAEDITNFVQELDVGFEVLVDRGSRIADQFGAQRTPEAFLLDDELKLRYQGRINDQYAPGVAKTAASREDLRIAIEELLAGKPVSVKSAAAQGCIIGRDKRATSNTDSAPADAKIAFADVLPVLERNCIECHRSGEIGPFAMNSYEQIVGWADTMLEVVDNGRMPPWHASPDFGHFANERIMSDADKSVLRGWVAAGAPLGEGEMPLPAVPADEEQIAWQFGQQPDVVVPMRGRPFSVPSGGVVEYQYFVVDPGFTQDRWVKAAQVVPGSRDVVHHAIVFVRPPDGSRFQGVGWLSAYVPGQRAVSLPEGYARLIPAGSKFVFQMHYTPNGTPREDVTQVGLVFADANDVTHNVFTLMALDQEFEIPPEASDHPVRGELQRIPRGAELLAATPHMHFRGKSFTLFAGADETPGTSAETLLHVPAYDFNWQHTYQFAQPRSLDDLQGLRFEAAFDNSKNNPFNPNPSEWVTWGDQTWEEMAVAFFEVAVPRNPSAPQSTQARDSRATVAVAADESTAELSAQETERLGKIDAYVQRVLKRLDQNNDQAISKSETGVAMRKWNFWRWDLNGDDVASLDEIRQVAERLYP